MWGFFTYDQNNYFAWSFSFGTLPLSLFTPPSLISGLFSICISGAFFIYILGGFTVQASPESPIHRAATPAPLASLPQKLKPQELPRPYSDSHVYVHRGHRGLGGHAAQVRLQAVPADDVHPLWPTWTFHAFMRRASTLQGPLFLICQWLGRSTSRHVHPVSPIQRWRSRRLGVRAPLWAVWPPAALQVAPRRLAARWVTSADQVPSAAAARLPSMAGVALSWALLAWDAMPWVEIVGWSCPELYWLELSWVEPVCWSFHELSFIGWSCH